MDRGALWTTVHGVAMSQTRLSMHTEVSKSQLNTGNGIFANTDEAVSSLV